SQLLRRVFDIDVSVCELCGVRSVSSPPSRIRQSWKRFSVACPSLPNRRRLLPLAANHAAWPKTSFLRPAWIRVCLRRHRSPESQGELPNCCFLLGRRSPTIRSTRDEILSRTSHLFHSL